MKVKDLMENLEENKTGERAMEHLKKPEVAADISGGEWDMANTLGQMYNQQLNNQLNQQYASYFSSSRANSISNLFGGIK